MILGIFCHFWYNFSISSKIASSNLDFEIIISRIYGISRLGSSTASTLRTYDSTIGSKPFNLISLWVRFETKKNIPLSSADFIIFFEFRYMNRSWLKFTIYLKRMDWLVMSLFMYSTQTFGFYLQC